ncbi:MAG: hypothetical protein UV53_C0004G0042 [Candidatus Azambacteria bacterium GW2011_GWE1_42_9]|nr:MAG: hypothetical protein UU33_C0001G0321 [Candidatus Azambacteria bacterium GW2011_GWF1_41_10]KKS49355.1 MAG: hypothetical protein UV14_C0001G0101 [Candidatus Azambacteria bacterium GW2011_GWF2_42_22]KKS79612.1 MAG: hypothetical protein UV53_C0004G0042 [Candidatus Azambacteria bacterium GW2011_GWE1_42_9]KKT03466.1 MAG: hypothetical protein UV81_C0001G0062 [Candidatus Azambacteria bacterium GW2011_GWD1_43_18]KKT12494.1 MAG: hypothetical protein UV93_C0003G0056 [Candidatus Azambacteria bacter
MKHEILIYNKTRKRIPEKFIKTVIIKTLDFLRIKQPVAMAVLVIGKEEIKMLNKIWRKKNEAPDELSFGLNSRKNEKFANEYNGVLELGEIVVNIEKISEKKYLSKILVHGLLHLLGYNHSRIEILEKRIYKNL